LLKICRLFHSCPFIHSSNPFALLHSYILHSLFIRDDDDYVPDLPTAPSLATSSSSAGVGGDEDEDVTLKELKTAAANATTTTSTNASKASSSSSSSNNNTKGGKSKSSKKDNSEDGGVCSTCGRSGPLDGGGGSALPLDQIPLVDPVAEKKRLEALMIKSEVAAAQALMGITTTSGGGGGGGGVHTPDMKSQVDAISLLTSDSFRDFGKLVAQRVNEASGASKGGGALATRFYNELLLSGADKLGTHELAALAKVLDTIRNKKLQEERDKSKGASKSKKAAKVQVGGERHGVPLDDYDDDGDYGDYGSGGGGGGGGASTSGNSGNIGMSLALAGLTVTPTSAGGGAGGGGDGKFVRTKFNAEDDFM